MENKELQTKLDKLKDLSNEELLSRLLVIQHQMLNAQKATRSNTKMLINIIVFVLILQILSGLFSALNVLMP